MKLIVKKGLTIFLLLSISSHVAFSQFKSNIHLVLNEIYYVNGLLTVKYSILNSKEKDRIRVWIDVFNSKNDTIKARSWSGEVKKAVSGKDEKTAVWNLFNDGIDLVDSIKIKLHATVESRFYLDDPMILSTIYPGWGDYQIKEKKPYWVNGAMGYVFLGASVGMYYNAKETYNDKYLNANTPREKNTYFNNAKLSKNLSYAFAGVAGTIWAMDYIRLLKRKNEIRQVMKKVIPEREIPGIPSFKIVSALSEKVFVNTRLTNLQITDNSVKYVDLDENAHLDAFEEGFIQFELFNQGPAKAQSFYAKIHSIDKNNLVQFPDSVLIESISVNQSRTIRLPIRASKDIVNGETQLQVSISALYNRPVDPFNIRIPTRGFKYKNEISANELNSDIDFNIPELPPGTTTKFALIIGNEGYANEKTGLSENFNVPFARNDALAFKNYVQKVLGVKEENIVILLDAKRKEMSENIHILSDRVKQLKNNAELIFYFAGQGLADTLTTAPYLMPVDIPPSKIDRAFPIDSLYKKIADCKPSRGLVVLDAAFNNSGRILGMRGPKRPKFQYRPEVIPTNTVVFSAVWKNNDIFPYKEKNHGLFTYAFLKTLQNTKGKITYLEFDKLLNDEILSVVRIPNENRATATMYSKDISDIWQKWTFR